MYIIYISLFNYILPGNYCKYSRIYSPSDFAAVPDGNATPAQNTIILYCNMHNSITILYAVNYAILTNHKKIKKISKKVLTIVLTYVIIKSQQRQSNNAKPLHFNIKYSIEKHKKTNCRRSKVMTKTLLTIGLNDKDTERQEIETGAAKKHNS